MNNLFLILIGLSLLAVLASLFMGVFFLGKPGQENREKSNKLMMARVLFQGIALILFIFAMLSAGE